MHRAEASIEIAAPPETVFGWLLDPEHRLRWVEGLVESEEAGPGRFHEVVEQHGIRARMEVETARSEPPRLVEAHMTGRGVEATVRNRLEPTPPGTRLTVTVETAYHGLAARLAAPLVSRHADAALERSLSRLRELVEAG